VPRRRRLRWGEPTGISRRTPRPGPCAPCTGWSRPGRRAPRRFGGRPRGTPRSWPPPGRTARDPDNTPRARRGRWRCGRPARAPGRRGRGPPRGAPVPLLTGPGEQAADGRARIVARRCQGSGRRRLGCGTGDQGLDGGSGGRDRIDAGGPRRGLLGLGGGAARWGRVWRRHGLRHRLPGGLRPGRRNRGGGGLPRGERRLGRGLVPCLDLEVRFGLPPQIHGAGRHAQQRDGDQRHPQHAVAPGRRAQGGAGHAARGRDGAPGPRRVLEPGLGGTGGFRRDLGRSLRARLAPALGLLEQREEALQLRDVAEPAPGVSLPRRGHLVVPRGLPLDDPALEGGELPERVDRPPGLAQPPFAPLGGLGRGRRRGPGQVADGDRGVGIAPLERHGDREGLLPEEEGVAALRAGDLDPRLGDPGVVDGVLGPAALAADIHGRATKVALKTGSAQAVDPGGKIDPSPSDDIVGSGVVRTPTPAISPRIHGKAEAEPEVREVQGRSLR
jgi:hypothetical protein